MMIFFIILINDAGCSGSFEEEESQSSRPARGHVRCVMFLVEMMDEFSVDVPSHEPIQYGSSTDRFLSNNYLNASTIQSIRAPF